VSVLNEMIRFDDEAPVLTGGAGGAGGKPIRTLQEKKTRRSSRKRKPTFIFTEIDGIDEEFIERPAVKARLLTRTEELRLAKALVDQPPPPLLMTVRGYLKRWFWSLLPNQGSVADKNCDSGWIVYPYPNDFINPLDQQLSTLCTLLEIAVDRKQTDKSVVYSFGDRRIFMRLLDMEDGSGLAHYRDSAKRLLARPSASIARIEPHAPVTISFRWMQEVEFLDIPKSTYTTPVIGKTGLDRIVEKKDAIGMAKPRNTYFFPNARIQFRPHLSNGNSKTFQRPVRTTYTPFWRLSFTAFSV